MTRSDAIAHFGTIKNLSTALNCDRRAIYQWGSLVPEARQYEIEVKSGGAVLSDYSRQKALSTGGSDE